MSTVLLPTVLPAIAVAMPKLFETIVNPPKPGKVYYTCAIGNTNSWTCVKGRDVMPESLWVGVCKYQPESWQREAVMKKLDSKDVSFKS
jgi:hypothetical protein